MKHETDYDKPLFRSLGEHDREAPWLEAQVVNLADEISYNSHDCEDGLYSGLLSVEAACDADLFEEAVRAANDRGMSDDSSRLRYFIVGYLKNVQVSDLLQETRRRLDAAGIQTLDQVV